MNELYKKFGNKNNMNTNYRFNGGDNVGNFMNQFMSVLNNPGQALDILLQNQKIDQKMYDEMYPFRNEPAKVAEYLMSHGNSQEFIDIANKAEDAVRKRK